ncbi:cytokinesis regulator [Pseudozyma hubeiensis SY62]|uniref:Cytokinesis regulator n=1 Tax=Pseudozyma hubeiensis (strain SY62) TaxID=1305764 RepID=R9PFX0_PSEHS|nr:cytokinesis regulator [Pseudozyma hubeiensis SY62]GAC96990.1 cytokinesis regulator [Pseudozyma hubeiensis SY62]
MQIAGLGRESARLAGKAVSQNDFCCWSGTDRARAQAARRTCTSHRVLQLNAIVDQAKDSMELPRNSIDVASSIIDSGTVLRRDDVHPALAFSPCRNGKGGEFQQRSSGEGAQEMVIGNE